MSGLVIGLSVGFAAAGAVGAAALDFMHGFVNVFARGMLGKEMGTAKSAFVGAVGGLALGAGLGYGIEAITGPAEPTVAESCAARIAAGEKLVLQQDTAGNIQCLKLN